MAEAKPKAKPKPTKRKSNIPNKNTNLEGYMSWLSNIREGNRVQQKKAKKRLNTLKKTSYRVKDKDINELIVRGIKNSEFKFGKKFGGKHETNMLLVKIYYNEQTYYLIKKADNPIEIRSSDDVEILNIEQSFKLSCFKLCSGGVEKQYLLESYNYSNISILLLSEKINIRSKTKTISIFGFTFLDLDYKYNRNNIKVALICSNKKTGGDLLNLSENIGKSLNCDYIKLDSLEAPFTWYLSKGYETERGRNLVQFSSIPTRMSKIPKNLGLAINKNGTSRKMGTLSTESRFLKSNLSEFALLGVSGNLEEGIKMKKRLK